MPTPARPIKWALRNGNAVIVTVSGLLITRPSSSNQRGARLRTPVYASDPSNKESALRRRPQPKAVSTTRRKDGRKPVVDFFAGARKEPGCKRTSLLEDRKQAGRFLTFETWADQAAIEAHMTTPAIKAAGPMLVPILAKPFTQGISEDGLGRIRGYRGKALTATCPRPGVAASRRRSGGRTAPRKRPLSRRERAG
jgi:quinol monooxygenase YgiN